MLAGALPDSWVDGTRGPREPRLQTWAYEPSTFVLRQSPLAHFEAPFLYLFVGAQRAMLVDTGTGDVDLRGAVDQALAGRDVDLLVTHTHRHDDHVGGDAQLASRPRTTIVEPAAMGAVVELGGRGLDVLPIPGHHAEHVAFYDRATGLLLTGDTVYPGRLYVSDLSAFRASVERLIDFAADGRVVTHVLGSHIELSSLGEEYAADAIVHPEEHALALGTSELHDLRATLRAMGAVTVRTTRPHYVVVPA